jgi:hypothetical protein
MNENSHLYAISDLHLDHQSNWDALLNLPRFPDDWLILGGDVCESLPQLQYTLEELLKRFAGLIWVPGNHELWLRRNSEFQDSLEKYLAMVELCRHYGVLTPEDPWLQWRGAGGSHRVVPMTLFYDYSFCPPEVERGKEVAWAMDSGILCADEKLIKFSQYSSLVEWCQARVEQHLQKLALDDGSSPLILVNHFPLRYDLVRVRKIPRFSIWCGTEKTSNWHVEFPVATVISGHLHVRATDYKDGVRFEEVSLGYPRDWHQEKGLVHYLRKILPAPEQQSLETKRWY